MKKNNNISSNLALSLMLCSILASSLSRGLFRFCLAEHDGYNPLHLLAGQSFLGAMLLGCYLVLGKKPLFPSVALPGQIARAFVAVIAYDLLLHSLKLFPLYITTLIGLSTILLTTVASIILFEKKIPALSLIMGLGSAVLGAMISVKSGDNPVQTGIILFPILATVLFSISSLLLKKMLIQTRRDESLQQLFSLLCFMSLFLLPSFSSLGQITAVLCWQPVWLLTLLYVLSQGCYIAAYYYAPLSELSAIKFFKIPLAAVLDYAVFARSLNRDDLIATFFILLGIVLSKRGSSKGVARKKKAPRFAMPTLSHTKVLS